jgi:hypothetical protein
MDYSKLGEGEADANEESARVEEPAKTGKKAALPDAPPVPLLSQQSKGKEGVKNSDNTVNDNQTLFVEENAAETSPAVNLASAADSRPPSSSAFSNSHAADSCSLPSSNAFPVISHSGAIGSRSSSSSAFSTFSHSQATSSRPSPSASFNLTVDSASIVLEDLPPETTPLRGTSGGHIGRREAPTTQNDINKQLITNLLETKAAIKDLQRQTQINTQLLQTILDAKGDDTILDTCNLPIDNKKDLLDLERLLTSDKAIFTKLVSISVTSRKIQ